MRQVEHQPARAWGREDLVHPGIGRPTRRFEPIAYDGRQRTFGQNVQIASVAELRGQPAHLAEAFLWRLELGEVIASGQRSRWSITSKTERGWSDRRRRAEDLERRRADIRSTVGRILQMVEHGERNGFDLERWWQRRHPRIGTSFAQAFEKDDHRLNELAFVVNQMESMLFRGGKIVEDTFGLPVAGAVGREIQARHDREEAERVEAEAAERRRVEERVASLAGEAWTILQHQSSAWLDGASTELGTTPRAAAAESYDGLALARSTLRHHVAELERTRALERLRGRLLSLAAQMRRPEHARVFLTSPHPDWRGRHPIECCVDEKTFEDIRKRMAKIAS